MNLTVKRGSHLIVLLDNEYIKSRSINTLFELLREAGTNDIRFERAACILTRAKSFIDIIHKA